VKTQDATVTEPFRQLLKELLERFSG